MNKREIQKQETRHIILEEAKKEFVKNGFLKTNTKTIADNAGVAHGTLFLHFKTKEMLMERVLEILLQRVEIQLKMALNNKPDVESLLAAYLDFIEKEEDFYEVISKEMHYYPKDIRIRVYLKDAAATNYFYSTIERGIKSGVYKNVDIKMALTFLFGTINYLLSNKENILKHGSIIAYKRESLAKTFMEFLRV